MSAPGDALDREILVPMTVREFLHWQAGGEEAPFDGVSTSEAAEILGDDWTERDMRRFAARCLRLQAQGARPPVRVSRTSAADNAHWRFDRSDLEAIAESDGPAGPRLVASEAPDPNHVPSIAAAYLREAGG